MEAGCDSYCTLWQIWRACKHSQLHAAWASLSPGKAREAARCQQHKWTLVLLATCNYESLFFPMATLSEGEAARQDKTPPQLLDGELPFVLAVAKTVALLFTLLCLSLHLFPFCPLSQALFCHTHPLLFCGYTQAHTHFPQGLFSSNKLTSVA